MREAASQGQKAGQASSLKTPEKLNILYTSVKPEQKVAHFLHFLKFIQSEKRPCKMIAYFLTCACVEYFAAVCQYERTLVACERGTLRACAFQLSNDIDEVRVMHVTNRSFCCTMSLAGSS